MREVRVESLEEVEVSGGELRLSANGGELRLVFPEEVWETAVSYASSSEEPGQEDLAELERLKGQLKAHAGEGSFSTVIEGVECGSSGLEYDLVLKPAALYAATTGYFFAPVVELEHMARVGVELDEDDLVEQAYLIGAAAEPEALAAGDENLKALSVRGRRCSSSRFEMPPELWQVLRERLGWNDVETHAST